MHVIAASSHLLPSGHNPKPHWTEEESIQAPKHTRSAAIARAEFFPTLEGYHRGMDLKNVGGTPGGMRTFLLGMGMAIVGGYLLLQEVQVHGGYWNWGFGGYGRSFGITLIPLLLGIGMVFANGRSFAGRFLVGAGALIILAGIIMNLDIHFQTTSLFNTLVMLILLVGGVGLIVRAALPMGEKREDRAE
jgi:hypothetical protein